MPVWPGIERQRWSAKHASDTKAYEDYLKAKATYETDRAKYLQDLEKYNLDVEKHEQLSTENVIYDTVTEYNQKIEGWNSNIQQKNDALENDLHADNVENIGEAGNSNTDGQVSDEILRILGGYTDLMEEQDELLAAAEALATHAGKNASLGSQEYTDYLTAVEAYNIKVNEFNAAVEEYNAAVDAYNEAVDTYNENKPADSESSTGTGTTQGTASIDWGNIAINNDTLGHIDVKYQAAASKDVTYVNGEPSYSDTVTQYEVTGVYTDETAADGGKSMDYGLVFDNDGAGEQASGTQDLTKDANYAEFGSNHFGFHQHSYEEVETLDTTKTYYISNGSGYFTNYQEIKYDSRTGTWKTTGKHSQTIDVRNRSVYEMVEEDKVALDPASGTVSFYVTLDDGEETHGINVNLNAGSVYAKGSYYKAKYDYEGNETDYLHYYEDSKGGKIPVVWIENENGVKEKYYDISGRSVYLISALTCDGMQINKDGDLNPDGLDLILNLQTMIEIHQSENAKKVSYLNYEKGKTAQAEEPGEPGDAPKAPTEPTAPNFVPEPDEAPKEPEAPKAPEFVPSPMRPPRSPKHPRHPNSYPSPMMHPMHLRHPRHLKRLKSPAMLRLVPKHLRHLKRLLILERRLLIPVNLIRSSLRLLYPPRL